jgi:uncharacterized protein involved in exopolysaccharide biosynthesis
MENNNTTLRFIDYLIIIIKWKHILIPVLLLTMTITYLTIYFFVKEEFKSTALIIPSDDQSMGGIAGLLSTIQGLPSEIGGQLGGTEMNIYNTIIYSRTFLQDVIDRFDLIEEYEISKQLIDHKELALKQLASSIEIDINDDMAYEISVSAYSPEKSAEMTNYIINKLNDRIIELKIQKSKNNRKFLGKRLEDVRINLTIAEDSLRAFQERTGMIEAEEQVKEILSVYSELETQLITKEIELSILKQINFSSPQFETSKIQVEELDKKINELKSIGVKNSPFLSLKSVPQKAINYFRFLREVEINNEILKFILPLYEQAKFEEQKDVPILQVIDYAIPPAKKTYPPRMILTLSITFFVFLMIFSMILVKENENWKNEPKYRYIKQNLFRWKAKV